MFKLTLTLVAKPLQSSSQSSSWAGQRSHDWFTYEMLYERQLSGICAGTRHIAIVFVIASLYYFSQYVFMSYYSLSCNICNCICNYISLSFFKTFAPVFVIASLCYFLQLLHVGVLCNVSLCLVLI